jgi:DNA adenine methylase
MIKVPFLKWTGGKSRTLHLFKDYFPDINNIKGYIEPFLGGGSVYFYLRTNYNLDKKPIFLSDINKDLINCYRIVRDKNFELIKSLEIHEKYNRKIGEKYYIGLRDQFPNYNSNDIDNAATFIYLNKAAFANIWNVNGRGKMNVPYSRVPNLKIIDDGLKRGYYSNLLSGTNINAISFENILNIKDLEGYFAYLDPPYFNIKFNGRSDRNFTGYSKDGFDLHHRTLLPGIFKKLDERGCKVMMSNANSSYVYKLFKDYNIKIIETNRITGISLSNIDRDKLRNAEKLTEVIVTNYKPYKPTMKQMDIFNAW